MIWNAIIVFQMQQFCAYTKETNKVDSQYSIPFMNNVIYIHLGNVSLKLQTSNISEWIHFKRRLFKVQTQKYSDKSKDI